VAVDLVAELLPELLPGGRGPRAWELVPGVCVCVAWSPVFVIPGYIHRDRVPGSWCPALVPGGQLPVAVDLVPVAVARGPRRLGRWPWSAWLGA
jgi:hypothetical protein